MPTSGIVIPKILKRGTTEPVITENEKQSENITQQKSENVNQKKSERHTQKTVPKQSLNCKDKCVKENLRSAPQRKISSENDENIADVADSVIETVTSSPRACERDYCRQTSTKQHSKEGVPSQFVPVLNNNSRLRFTVSSNHYLRRGHYQYHPVFRNHQHSPSSLQYVIIHHPVAASFNTDERILVQNTGRVLVTVRLLACW